MEKFIDLFSCGMVGGGRGKSNVVLMAIEKLDAGAICCNCNVVVTAIQEAGLRGQLAATRRLLELQHQLTEKVRRQKTVGTVILLDPDELPVLLGS